MADVVDTGIKVYRLAEWPADYPTSPEYRRMIELRCALLAKPNRTFVNMPAIEIAEHKPYLEALQLLSTSDTLFRSLPAAVRANFNNNTANFLLRLRDREIRDALAAEKVMYFEGEGPECLVGRRPDQKEGNDG